MNLAILGLLVLVGCATTEQVWVKHGATNEDFHMDSGQCRARLFLFLQSGVPNGGMTIHMPPFISLSSFVVFQF